MVSNGRGFTQFLCLFEFGQPAADSETRQKSNTVAATAFLAGDPHSLPAILFSELDLLSVFSSFVHFLSIPSPILFSGLALPSLCLLLSHPLSISPPILFSEVLLSHFPYSRHAVP